MQKSGLVEVHEGTCGVGDGRPSAINDVMGSNYKQTDTYVLVFSDKKTAIFTIMILIGFNSK